MPGWAADLLKVPASFWERREAIEALRSRDIGALFRLLRQYAGASQRQIAIACGMTQGKVSETMKKGGRQVLTLEVFERIADGLGMPDVSRVALGIAPREFVPQLRVPTEIQPRDSAADLESAAFVASLGEEPHVGV